MSNVFVVVVVLVVVVVRCCGCFEAQQLTPTTINAFARKAAQYCQQIASNSATSKVIIRAWVFSLCFPRTFLARGRGSFAPLFAYSTSLYST